MGRRKNQAAESTPRKGAFCFFFSQNIAFPIFKGDAGQNKDSKKSRNIVKNLAVLSKKSRNRIVKNLAIAALKPLFFAGSAALKRIYYTNVQCNYY